MTEHDHRPGTRDRDSDPRVRSSAHPDSFAGGVARERPSLEREALFDLLGNDRRRYVIRFLRRHDGSVPLGTLATHVAALENETSVGEVSADQRKLVYTSLQQTHLPRLDEVGALEFDKERGTVTPSARLSEFTLHLDVVPSSGLPPSTVYLALAAASVLVLVAVLARLPLVSEPSPFAWAAAVVVAFGVTAAVRTASRLVEDRR